MKKMKDEAKLEREKKEIIDKLQPEYDNLLKLVKAQYQTKESELMAKAKTDFEKYFKDNGFTIEHDTRSIIADYEGLKIVLNNPQNSIIELLKVPDKTFHIKIRDGASGVRITVQEQPKKPKDELQIRIDELTDKIKQFKEQIENPNLDKLLYVLEDVEDTRVLVTANNFYDLLGKVFSTKK